MGGEAGAPALFLLALAVVAVVFTVDTVLSADSILVELLVAGPLLAAVRCSVRETTIVAVAAALLAFASGAITGVLGEEQQVIGLVVVTGGGALAWRVARLRAARAAATNRLRVQYRVARILSESESLDDAAPLMLEEVGARLGWDVTSLWLPGEDGALQRAAAWRAPGYAGPDPDAELAERASRAGEATYLPDAPASSPPGGVAFPVSGPHGTLGTVALHARAAFLPDPGITAFTEAIAQQLREFSQRQDAAQALVRSEARTREARDQLEAILSGVADAVTAQSPEGGLLFANDAAVTMLGFDTSEELLAAPPSEVLARFDIYSEDGLPFRADDLPGRRALAGEDGEVVVRFRVRATGEERWSAIKATPITGPDGTVVMAINVIEDISAHKRVELAQRFLAESSAALAASLDLNELPDRVAQLAVPELADWCAVDLWTDGTLERVALRHVDPRHGREVGELARRHPPDPHSPYGQHEVLRTGRSLLHRELSEEFLAARAGDPEHARMLRDLGVRSVMVVPLVARGRTMGTLTLVSGRSGRRYDEVDLELAEELARRAATSIDNVRLYSERSYIARTLQQSLLPVELPEIPGLEAAARFRAMGEGNDVGGDFYDMFESGGRGWTVVMGDVCGKGPDAAAVTALARYTLRAAAMQQRLPSRSLALLNEALLRQRSDRRFCTVAYAYLEMLDGGARVGLASGGHPLPLLLRCDGSVEPAGHPGTLLGVVPDPTFEDRSLALSPGDALVFYTDGVIEAGGSRSLLDEHALADVVRGCAGEGADAIAAEVERAALGSAAGELRDDIAVLVLRVA